MNSNNEKTARTVYRRKKTEARAVSVSEQSSEQKKKAARALGAKLQRSGARPSLRTSAPRQPREPARRTPVKIIPLGGLNEIGKNCTAIECANDMLIIDCGMAFPDKIGRAHV